jgi:hypothetical protein
VARLDCRDEPHDQISGGDTEDGLADALVDL